MNCIEFTRIKHEFPYTINIGIINKNIKNVPYVYMNDKNSDYRCGV